MLYNIIIAKHDIEINFDRVVAFIGQLFLWPVLFVVALIDSKNLY